MKEKEKVEGYFNKIIEEVERCLEMSGIKDREVIEKEGWGKVVRFNFRNKDLICNGFKNIRKDKYLDCYYYSEEYSCRTSLVKIPYLV